MAISVAYVRFENRHTTNDEKAALQDGKERTRPDDWPTMTVKSEDEDNHLRL